MFVFFWFEITNIKFAKRPEPEVKPWATRQRFSSEEQLTVERFGDKIRGEGAATVWTCVGER